MTSLAETILTLVIGAAGTISGWAAYAYQYISDKPKIKGKILNVMRGTFNDPRNSSQRLTSFVLFVYLTNMRKNGIHIQDYILEVDDGNGFKRMEKVFGDMSRFRFGSAKGEIEIPNFEQGVIYKQSKPVEFGVPYYGYLMFGGDLKYYDADIKEFRITCIDVFDNKHKITTKPKDFIGSLYYLQEVFKIKVPQTGIPFHGAYQFNTDAECSSNLINGNKVTTKQNKKEKTNDVG